jgi:uncharacterized protein YyaL (SSP411 family)
MSTYVKVLALLVVLGGGLFFFLRPNGQGAVEQPVASQESEPEMLSEASPEAEASPTSEVEAIEPTQAAVVNEEIAALEGTTQAGSNHLANEKSPYLLQHADNLIDWYPWGAEAFEKARQEDKPIFLSIGYSSCHWCHVMEEDSFEDPEVARLMNETFVSILVDREERPDIDNIYMEVSVMMTGGGGWPLNIMMTPEQKPFFASSYIPKETRFQQLGMMELSARVQEVWQGERDELVNIGEQVLTALEQKSNNVPGQELDLATLERASQQLSERFDAEYGGFGERPKFPSPHQLLFLLRYWERSGDPQMLVMVERTLQAMREGGVYDHIGLGFHRYAIDQQWRVPHFEKMLYDQAMLAMAYTEAYQATGKEEYAQTVREILSYVLRDMTAPNGGFYAAEDADSEGEEGTFYIWTEEQVRQVLPAEEADLIVEVYNLTAEGNYAEEASGEKNGTNIFYLTKPLAELAAERQRSEEELALQLEAARQSLFQAREGRIHPHKDDKILTDWNGLMIAAFAKAGQALNEPAYAQTATQAADFILNNMRDENGRLLHRYREGDALYSGNLDDYAFFVWGLLELYESTFELRHLQDAIGLSQDMRTHFWDPMGGGFFFTPDDGEDLLVRQKEIDDGAIPSGNAVAMDIFLRLGRLTAKTSFEEDAAMVGRAFAGNVQQAPSAFTHLMSALNFALGPSYEIVIVGEPGAADTQAMLSALQRTYVPNKVVLLRPPGEAPDLVAVAEFTKYQFSIDGQATAYVCLNYYCELPTTDVAKMLELLTQSSIEEVEQGG